MTDHEATLTANEALTLLLGRALTEDPRDDAGRGFLAMLLLRVHAEGRRDAVRDLLMTRLAIGPAVGMC